MSNIKPSVLIVDDDNVYRFAAVKIIAATEMAGNIIECNDGQEALNFIRKNIEASRNLPDIIFLDINMPVMNGWDFLKSFSVLAHQLPKAIQIYVVTSSIDRTDVDRSKEFSVVTDYIVKPVTKETFSRLLSAVRV
jgi:two-component SAPR family response regulator